MNKIALIVATMLCGCTSMPVLEINIKIHNPGIKIGISQQIEKEASPALSADTSATDMLADALENEESTAPAVDAVSPGPESGRVSTDGSI